MNTGVDQARERSDGGFRESGLSSEEIAWGVPSPPRSYWPARVAVLAAIVLYTSLPDLLIPGPRWIVPILEGAVLVVLSVFTPHRTTTQSPLRRSLALVLVAILSAVNLINLGLLVRALLRGGIENGSGLIFSAAAVWFTNVIVFALWYWELDRGGPEARHSRAHREPDFLFPQMTTPGSGRPDWAPDFVDYLFVSFTNATAFSPTDTMPLSSTAKILMAVQALASLLTVGLVAARAVNILR